MAFEEHRGDQVTRIIYGENETGRTAGLTIWDRPDTPLPQVVSRHAEIQRLRRGPARQRAEAAFEGFGSTLVFVGKSRQQGRGAERVGFRSRPNMARRYATTG